MSLLNSLSGAALRQAANIKDKIQALEKELLQVLNNTTIAISVSGPVTTVKKKGGMSAAGKAKIAAAQKRRWAKVKAAKPQAKPAVKATVKQPAKKGGMSATGRARIAAAAKARWAKAKAAGKKSL
jgi:hypothetical protein